MKPTRRRVPSRGRASRRTQRRPLRRYGILIEKGPNSYGISVPDLPGCFAVGATRREAIRLIRGAIRMHLDAMEQDGDPIPEPTAICEMVEVEI
jgi:predicted RNase H-like HicB family nuclease